MPNKAEIKPYHGEFKALYVNGVLEMSDLPIQLVQYDEFFENYHGDILILGLGMGVLNDRMDYSKVNSVDVVELYPEVIALNKDFPKTTMIQADAHQFTPTKKYDTIWIDCWNLLTLDNLDSMRAMKEKFSKYINPGGYVQCWGLQELEERYRR